MDSSNAGLFPGRAGLDGGTLPAVPARRWGRKWGNDSEAIEVAVQRWPVSGAPRTGPKGGI